MQSLKANLKIILATATKTIYRERNCRNLIPSSVLPIYS